MDTGVNPNSGRTMSMEEEAVKKVQKKIESTHFHYESVSINQLKVLNFHNCKNRFKFNQNKIFKSMFSWIFCSLFTTV